MPLTATFTPKSSNLGGSYSERFNLTTNDPFNPLLAINLSLKVNSKPVMALSPSSLVFQATSVANPGRTTIMISNLGNKSLVISSVASTLSDYSLSGVTLPVTIGPGVTLSPTVIFNPKALGTRIGTFTFSTNISTGPAPTLRCTGLAIEPPSLSVTPGLLRENMGISQTLTRSLTINNTGADTLKWSASVNYLTTPTGPASTTLPEVLKRLDKAAPNLTALIPDLYSFTEGTSGNSIIDGGNDMYDTGNFLSTSLGSKIPYSNGVVSTHAALGTGGSYFTRKSPGLFAFVGDLAGPTSFSTSGNLGADGAGLVSVTSLFRTVGGMSYQGFIKRVYSSSNPSVNHLIIVASRSGLGHGYSTSTDSDLHFIDGLSGSSRVYYLLFATQNGSFVSTATFGNVMDYFLANVAAAPGTGWLSLNSLSGSVSPDGTASLSCSMKSAGLSGGTYTAQVRFTSNDPANTTLDVPVSITVESLPNFFTSPSSLSFSNTFVNDRRTELLTVSSTGNTPLIISSLETTHSSFTVTGVTLPLTIPQGQSQNLTVEFTPTSLGTMSESLLLQTNVSATPTSVLLIGTGVAAPLVTVSPTSLEVTGGTGSHCVWHHHHHQ